MKGNKQRDKTVQTSREATEGPGRLQKTKEAAVAPAGLSARMAWAKLSRAWRSRSWHSCSVSWNWRQASSRMELLRGGKASQ